MADYIFNYPPFLKSCSHVFLKSFLRTFAPSPFRTLVFPHASAPWLHYITLHFYILHFTLFPPSWSHFFALSPPRFSPHLRSLITLHFIFTFYILHFQLFPPSWSQVVMKSSSHFNFGVMPVQPWNYLTEMIEKVRFVLYLESSEINIAFEGYASLFWVVVFSGKWGVWN